MSETEPINRKDDDDSNEDQSDRSKSRYEFVKKHSGVLIGLTTGLAEALLEVQAKKGITIWHPCQIQFLRYSQSFIILLIYCLFQRGALYVPSEERIYLLVRIVFASAGNVMIYCAFEYLPYLDTLVISYGILAISSAVIARLWIKEAITLFSFIMMIFILSGVIMAAQPKLLFSSYLTDTFSHRILVGLIWAFASGMFVGAGGCLIKRLMNTPIAGHILYFSVCSLVISLVEMSIYSDFQLHLNKDRIFLALSIGLLSGIVNLAWVKGWQISNITEMSLAMQVEIPAAMLFQWWLLQGNLNIFSIIGGILVVISIILNTLQNSILKLCSRSRSSTEPNSGSQLQTKYESSSESLETRNVRSKSLET
ncbi:Uncharacterised protein r2_g4330 [Pycnogonum litorale]